MVFGFLKGQFIDVIHWVDDTRDTMVWRLDRHGHAIMYGAKLTVREGQAAVFIHEGQLADVFGPGLYMLETNNMPVLTALQHWDHGFSSPFKSEVYFVNTTRFTGQKWGTRSPVMLRDPEFGPLRVRAFGAYSMRVVDPGRFMTEIVGTDGEFTTEEISVHIRDVIVQEFSRVVARAGIPALDMAANLRDLGKLVAAEMAPAVAAYGLELPDFVIENISLPEAVEKVLDQRTSMGIVGDLAKYGQFAAAEAMGKAADAPGSAMGAGLGAAMGAAMGVGGPWGGGGARGAAPPAPPPVPAPEWHVAEGGQSLGPFDMAGLQGLAAQGRLGRATQVWTPGMAGWQPAGDVPALASVVSRLPPPPPQG
ncbi:MAG: SPFH domain-containing protein [Gemmobacter sp.]|nr:SPFH domain-containing protein [Gemmobacter sp.]